MSGGAILARLLNRRALSRRRAPDYAAFTALGLIVAFGPPAFAAGEDAAQLFHTGRAAFEKQDYAAALEFFEAAADANLRGPAVHFNIGVTAFHLGRYARAETAFREVARTPGMAALAHYNLGLVALRRGDARAAARWFTRTAQETFDERLRALASDQLASLPPVPARNWAGYASVGAGYDDNVALISDASVLGVSGVDDSFAEAQLALSAPLGHAWRFDAGLVFLDYQELDRFDQLSAQSGARYRLLTGSWTNDFTLQLAYTTLDGEGFDNKRTLALQTSRELSAHWRMRARYRFSDIDGMNEFAGVGGLRHEVGARFSWLRGPWDLGVAFDLDASDHDDDALSATRHQFAFDAQRELSNAWLVAFDAALRNSSYDVASNGEETRVECGLAITRTLSTRWRLVVRYAYADNDSDLTEFNYQRNRISASLEALL